MEPLFVQPDFAKLPPQSELKQNADATESVSEVTREQAATTAQMTSAAQELTNLSLDLQAVVSRFKLDEEQ